MIEPTLVELLRRAIDSRIADVHVSLPGIVKSYDADKQVADIVPAVRRVLFNDDGDPVEEELAVLQNVPVEWPGGGGFYLHFPLAAGDEGSIVVHERSIVEWRTTGNVSTPGDLRLHALGSVTFRPGLRNDKNPRADAPASGEGVIAVGAGVLRVGPSSGSQFVALADYVDARFAAIHDAISSAVPAPPSGPDAGEVGLLQIQSALAAPFVTVAATKLRAK